LEADETNAALNQTVSQLRGGVVRVQIASAIPNIAGWERTLEATSLPRLAPVAENSRALRTTLTSEDSHPAEVGRLLTCSGIRAVAASPYGLPVAIPLAQLSLLLNAGGGSLAGQTPG